jgi:multiple sugar transport system permease protein
MSFERMKAEGERMKVERHRLPSTGYHLLAVLVSLLCLLPLLWMVAASLRQTGTPLPRTLDIFPWPPAWENYVRIFQIVPLGRYLLNSLIVTGLAVPLTLLTASLAGFGMSQLPRKARARLLVLSILLQMVPVTALWLTRFLLLAWIGLTNSHFALIAPALMGASPLFILLFYWSFRRVPLEQYESARLDGASPISTWRLIGLPQARPALLAVGLLAFLFFWNDFINPLLYLKSTRLYTLPVGLMQLQELDKTNWPLLMAASVLVTLPPVGVFLWLQHALLGEGIYSES